MNEYALKDLCFALIAYCQRNDLLSTSSDDLAGELSDISDICDQVIYEILEY